MPDVTVSGETTVDGAVARKDYQLRGHTGRLFNRLARCVGARHPCLVTQGESRCRNQRVVLRPDQKDLGVRGVYTVDAFDVVANTITAHGVAPADQFVAHCLQPQHCLEMAGQLGVVARHMQKIVHCGGAIRLGETNIRSLAYQNNGNAGCGLFAAQVASEIDAGGAIERGGQQDCVRTVAPDQRA